MPLSTARFRMLHSKGLVKHSGNKVKMSKCMAARELLLQQPGEGTNHNPSPLETDGLDHFTGRGNQTSRGHIDIIAPRLQNVFHGAHVLSFGGFYDHPDEVLDVVPAFRKRQHHLFGDEQPSFAEGLARGTILVTFKLQENVLLMPAGGSNCLETPLP